MQSSKVKLPAQLSARLDAEITRRLAENPGQRPVPNRSSVSREALEFFLKAVSKAPDLRLPADQGPFPFAVQIRHTAALEEQLNLEVARQIGANPSQRPLPGRASLCRAALELYLTHQEAQHGQPALPFPTSGGVSDDKS